MHTQTSPNYTEQQLQNMLEGIAIAVNNRPPAGIDNFFAFNCLASVQYSTDPELRKEALRLAMRLCVKGDDLLLWASKLLPARGFGRAVKMSFRTWYLDRPTEEVLYDVHLSTKVNELTHKKLIRKLHLKPRTPREEAVMGFILNRPHDTSLIPELYNNLSLMDEALNDTESSRVLLRHLLCTCGLPISLIPDILLNRYHLWECLFEAEGTVNDIFSNMDKLVTSRTLSFEKYRKGFSAMLKRKDVFESADIDVITNGIKAYKNTPEGAGDYPPYSEITHAMDLFLLELGVRK